MAEKTYNNNERKWLKPKTRAAGYAEERKKGIHERGPKKNQPLDDYNKGLRSGYMLAQSDNAGSYRYKMAMNAGLTKQQAQKFSREKGTKLPDGKGKKTA